MDSTIRGIPLSEEQLGALTLGGFLREVCAKHADKEALVCHAAGRPVVRMTYAQVWAEASSVARAFGRAGRRKGDPSRAPGHEPRGVDHGDVSESRSRAVLACS